MISILGFSLNTVSSPSSPQDSPRSNLSDSFCQVSVMSLPSGGYPFHFPSIHLNSSTEEAPEQEASRKANRDIYKVNRPAIFILIRTFPAWLPNNSVSIPRCNFYRIL